MAGSGKTRGRPRTVAVPKCPNPLHRNSDVVARGSRTLPSGKRLYYTCRPADRTPHTFTVLDTATTVVGPSYSPPPTCLLHPGGHVVRNGTYARIDPDTKQRVGVPRQRYRCYPPQPPVEGKRVWHDFTPKLARDHVHAGTTHCEHCDELRGVHRGDQTVARRHSWPLRIVAEGLARLASGETYSEVGAWAWRVTGRVRTRPAALPQAERDRRQAVRDHARAVRAAERAGTKPPPWPAGLSREPVTEPGTPRRRRRLDADGNPKPRRRKPSPRGAEARNRWHTAADWVEVYAPTLWQPLHRDLLAAEHRAAHAKRPAGATRHPSVLLINDIPVNARVADPDTGKTRSARAYFVLGAATVTWPDDPMTRPDDRHTKLRLLRAYPSNEATAWLLLFHELGFIPGAYEPDFVLADAGTGLLKAVGEYFTTTVLIPSVFHINDALEEALTKTPGARVETPAGKRLLPELAAYLATLSGDNLRAMSDDDWTHWWDGLEATLTRLRLPVDKVRLRRTNYEKPVKTALPHLRANPGLPLSTGGFEKVLRRTAQRVLSERRHGFANIERTNHLLDLVVCRDRGIFDKTTTVVNALRTDQQDNAGWSAPPRAVADPQPPAPDRYSSLRDPLLLATLAPALPVQPRATRKKNKKTPTATKTGTGKTSAGKTGRTVKGGRK